MSKPWPFICPACDREFRGVDSVRDHAKGVSGGRDGGDTVRGRGHRVVFALPDIAFGNPAFGEDAGPGKITWPVDSPQYAALAPMRAFDERGA